MIQYYAGIGSRQTLKPILMLFHITPYQHETPYVTIYIDDKKNPSPYKPHIHAELHQDGSVNVSLDTSMLANTAITVKEAIQMHKEFTEAIKAARDLKTTVLMKVPA